MALAPFKLERYFARYEFKAAYLLCASDCESLSVAELLSFEPEASRQLQELWLGYTESQGSPELKAAIAELYERIDPQQILVHAGAEEAIYAFMRASLQPGDHAIVHFPCYQSLEEVARQSGCEVTRWVAREEDNWELDLDFLKNAIRPTTRLIVLNCPHNPTGYLMSASRQQQLVEIARQHNLLLFSDEVYRYSEHDPQDRLPAACDLYENAVSLGVMSKTFGLAGLRIGWLATRNRAVFERVAAYKDYLSICNSAPSEFLATLALRHKDRLIERNLDIIKANLGLLDIFFKRHQDVFNWQAPRAGSIAFPSLKTGQPIEEFCVELLERQGVLLLPGSYFEAGDRNFRLGFGRRNMPQGLEKMAEFLTDSQV